LDDLLARQAGVVTRRQLADAGVTRARLRTQITAGRWQRINGSVYAAFSGPLPRRSMLWAAVLDAGAGRC
jgi:hypothetical protein